MSTRDEHTREFLLAFDGRIHHLAQGYWLKFEIERIKPTRERPHGLRYSLTLHDASGKRMIGFDNAHSVPKSSRLYAIRPVEHDHWHRTGDDEGRHDGFTSADQLLADFFREVEQVLSDRGISSEVIPSGVEFDRSEGQGLCPWTPLEASREGVQRTTPPDRHLFVSAIKLVLRTCP